MYTYKTKDGSDRIFPGIGETVNGVIESESPIESPVLELVESEKSNQPTSGVTGVAPNQSQNAVNEANKVAPIVPEKPNGEQK